MPSLTSQEKKASQWLNKESRPMAQKRKQANGCTIIVKDIQQLLEQLASIFAKIPGI